MELVFIKILMRQVMKEFADIRAVFQLPGKLTQFRRADADHAVRRSRRNQLSLKIPVLRILQPEQLVYDFFSQHV